jgi:hypothetical protein
VQAMTGRPFQRLGNEDEVGFADLERQGQGRADHPLAHPRRHAGLPRRDGWKKDLPSRRLWTALREVDRYLTSQSAWLVNYADTLSAIAPVCGSALP